MKICELITASVLLGCLAISPVATADKLMVNITPTMGKVEVRHNNARMTIMRNQNENNVIGSEYATTSRKCPPFCIQPATLAPGVETVGELEVLGYLKRIANGDNSLLVVDSRTGDWVVRGTIPGSINIPWTKLKDDSDPLDVIDILTQKFGATEQGRTYDFSKAKTLLLFCNGAWCSQSPTNIRRLLALGYPANKLKWYRGGMQDWEALGLTVVK